MIEYEPSETDSE